WFVAYFKIPSFIVTLAGMLVFKGLALALLAGQSVGPFPETFQKLSSGFIPDPLAGTELRLTSLLLGAGVALAMVAIGWRARSNQQLHAMETEPMTLFVVRNVMFAAIIVALA